MSHVYLFDGAQVGAMFDISDALRDSSDHIQHLGHELRDTLNAAQTGDVAKDAKLLLDLVSEPGWISVDDNLPELAPVEGVPDWGKSKKVLVFADRQMVAFLYQTEGCPPEWFTDCSESWRIKPTHWKHLGKDPV